MAKINKEEYEYLKSLDDKRKWIARDKDNSLYVFVGKPYKYTVYWEDEDLIYEQIDGEHFQFIQWEDEEPYNIADLIDEYESSLIKATPWTPYPLDFESEETEVSFKENLKQEVEKIMTVTDYEGGWTVIKKVDVDKLFDVIDQLDEPTLSKKVQLSQKSADELNRYKERGYSLKDLLVIAGSKQAQEKLARAWLDGYEVEEEQKYYVIDKEENILLIRGYEGIEKADNLKIANSGGGALKLTEQEIKDYDPRFWAFAVKVEELEE